MTSQPALTVIGKVVWEPEHEGECHHLGEKQGYGVLNHSLHVFYREIDRERETKEKERDREVETKKHKERDRGNTLHECSTITCMNDL